MSDQFTGSYQIAGVLPKQGQWDQELRVDMLFDDYHQIVGAVPKEVTVTREIWVAASNASQIGPVLAMDLRAGLPEGTQIYVSRSDSGAYPDFEAAS